ncbi:MAG: hypothetical protein MJ245_02010 [Clostridia bacterium]|nr:hypothetical protein [Clostridia bacterium]
MRVVNDMRNYLWDSKKFLYAEINGIKYGFEDEDCKKYFDDADLYDWTSELEESLVTIFNKYKMKIFVCHELENNNDDSNLCSLGNSTIFIRSYDSSKDALYHGIGHLICYDYKMYGNSLLMYTIAKEATPFVKLVADYYYDCAKKKYPNDQKIEKRLYNFLLKENIYLLNPIEYLPEAFAMYYCNKTKLHSECPLTYRLVDAMIHYYLWGCSYIKDSIKKLNLNQE